MHQLTEHLKVREDARPADRQPWALLVLLCVAQFMVILDITVVNVALPSIGRDLGFVPADLQWVVTAYVLMTGELLLLGGRVADLFGRRRVFLSGLLLFTAASLASGLAPSPTVLIASRAAQGLGAAMLSPAALSIITIAYTGGQRTTALSAWGALAGAGAAVLALQLVPAARARVGSLSELDLAGALTLVAGLVLLVYAVEGASTQGWGSVRTLVLLALSAGLVAAFYVIERRAEKPLIPTSTWRVRSLVSSATVMLGTTGILVGTFFLNSLFLQNVLGASALETGFAFLPLVVVIGVAAHLGPKLLTRFGARAVVIGGLALVTGGELLLTRAPAHAAYASDLLPGFVMIGLGIGFTFVAFSVTAMSEVTGENAGLASGLMTTAHEIGGAFGVSIFSAVALGSVVAGGGGFVHGYGQGAVAGALIAAALGLIALTAVPSFRPATAQKVALH